jgi:hypothetical protein
MYLRRVELHNVKLIKRLNLDFMRGEEPRMWTVIIGPNGTCKTAILQAIARAVAGKTSANTLGGGLLNRLQRIEGVDADSAGDERVEPKQAPALEIHATLHATHDGDGKELERAQPLMFTLKRDGSELIYDDEEPRHLDRARRQERVGWFASAHS